MLTPRRAGSRHHEVELQSVARADSGDGYLETWTTYATVWAGVRPASASASERFVAQTHQTPITHLVELDYRDDIKGQHRVLLKDTRALYIRGLQNEDERDVTLILSCEERVQ